MKMKIWIVGILAVASVAAYAKYGRTCAGGACAPSSAAISGSSITKTSVGYTTISSTVEGETFVPFEKAFADANHDNKLVMVDVFTDWCGWCKKLDRDVYPDAEVQKELHAYFAAAKVNAESSVVHAIDGKQMTERELAQRWKVTGFPTIVFLTSKGELIQALPGYLPPKQFAQVLRYMGTRSYEHETFEQWQSTHS
jgi:thioredoxin-related protein